MINFYRSQLKILKILKILLLLRQTTTIWQSLKITKSFYDPFFHIKRYICESWNILVAKRINVKNWGPKGAGLTFMACLRGRGRPQLGMVTHLGGVTRLSI